MCIKGDTTYTTHYMCKGIHEKFLGARQTCKSARRTAEQTAKLCTHTSARGTAMQKKGERKASRSQDAISQKIPSPLRPRQTQICPGNLVQTVMTVPQNRHDHDFDTSVRFATPFCFFPWKQFCILVSSSHLFHPRERYASGGAVCAVVLQAPLAVSRRPCTGAHSVREVSYLYEWSAAQSTCLKRVMHGNVRRSKQLRVWSAPYMFCGV